MADSVRPVKVFLHIVAAGFTGILGISSPFSPFPFFPIFFTRRKLPYTNRPTNQQTVPANAAHACNGTASAISLRTPESDV